jgi:hypothetical protein
MNPLILSEPGHTLHDRYTNALEYERYDRGITIDIEQKLSINYFASPADDNSPAMILWRLHHLYSRGNIIQLVDMRFYGERDVSILLAQLPLHILDSPTRVDKYVDIVNNLIFAPLMPNITIYYRETNGHNIIYANIDGVKRRLRLNNTVARSSEIFMTTNIYEKYGHEYSTLHRTASSLATRSKRPRPIVNTVPIREEQQLSGLHLTPALRSELPVAGSFISDSDIIQEDIEYVSRTIGRY